MDDWSEFRPNLSIFGVTRDDPGWLYLLKAGDLFKIGKTTNSKLRLKEATTWSPDIEVLAIKPFWNISKLEKMLHEAFANSRYKGEWFKMIDEAMRDLLVDGMRDFYEKDRDANSVDFIYWYNGSGMMEFRIERHSRRVSLRKFQKQLADKNRRTFKQ